MLDRRDVIKTLGAAFLASLAPLRLEALERSEALFAAACKLPDGRFGAALLSAAGEIVHVETLPERAHDLTRCPVSGRIAVFARRPGLFILVFDPAGRLHPQVIGPAPGRHFYGHGAFSPDGRLLYASENDFDAARGVVGVYDATAGFERIGEFDSFGTGPHEVLLSADGAMLAVANGGIETHPDYGRTKLNIATMQPSIAFVDTATGALLEKHDLPARWHQLSARHMDFTGENSVWFGGQYEGPDGDEPPLLGRCSRGEGLGFVPLPEGTARMMRNYVGSVAVNRDASRIAVSSPRGNAVLIFASDGNLLTTLELKDGCGLAPLGQGFIATSGEGRIARLAGSLDPVATTEMHWDNHILAVRQAGT